MAEARSKESPGKTGSVEAALRQVANRLADCRALRSSSIVVRASGPGGGDFSFDCAVRSARLKKGMPSQFPPTIEIIGDARRIQAVLAGRKDARTQFLAGAFRVRGDLHYFSDLAVELGILKEPL